MPSHPFVCSLRTGGVSANTPVQSSEFATSPADRYRILEQYSNVALVGLSSNPYRPSHFAAMYLIAAGYNVIPVNPREKQILGRPCYASLGEIPGPVEIVDIFRPPDAVPPIVEEAIGIGAKVIWMQFEVVHYDAARRAREAGLEVVMDQCMKVEHARFFGALHTLGLNTGVISSRAWSPKAGSKR
jgi:predicted CoA-binding protein